MEIGYNRQQKYRYSKCIIMDLKRCADVTAAQFGLKLSVSDIRLEAKPFAGVYMMHNTRGWGGGGEWPPGKK